MLVAGLFTASLANGDVPDILKLAGLTQLHTAGCTYLDSITITSPQHGAMYLAPDTMTSLNLPATAETNCNADTASVDWDLDGSYVDTSTTPPDYGITITVPLTDTLTQYALEALATGVAQYNAVSDAIQFSVDTYETGGDPGDPPPADVPESVPMQPILDGFTFVDTQPPYDPASGPPAGGTRQVYVILLGGTAKTGSSTEHTITDPYDPTRSVTVSVPDALFETGEEGLLFLAVGDTQDRLLGDTPPANMASLPGDLVDGGYYCEIDLLLTTDGGATFFAVPGYRLQANPLGLTMAGLSASKSGDEAKLYMYPTLLFEEDDEGKTMLSFEALGGASDWDAVGANTAVNGGTLTAQLSEVGGVVAPFKVVARRKCGSSSKFTYGLVFLVAVVGRRKKRR